MTNGDKIRQMTDEELAELFADDICRNIECVECLEVDMSCHECCLAWLKQEAKEDDG